MLRSPFLRMNRPLLDPQENAVRQVTRLGYDPADVRHVVLTHLDRDHAGGIADFPNANVHMYGPELRAAQARATDRERSRYLTQLWAHHRPRHAAPPDWRCSSTWFNTKTTPDATTSNACGSSWPHTPTRSPSSAPTTTPSCNGSTRRQ